MKPAQEWLNAVGEAVMASAFVDGGTPGDRVEKLIESIQTDAQDRKQQLATWARIQECHRAEVESLQQSIKITKAENVELRSKLTECQSQLDQKVAGVLFIRCTKHFTVPQINKNEFCGGECGACIAEQLAECQRQRDDVAAALVGTSDFPRGSMDVIVSGARKALAAHDAALVAQLGKEVAAAIQEHRFNGETDVRSVAASARMVFDARLRTIGKL